MNGQTALAVVLALVLSACTMTSQNEPDPANPPSAGGKCDAAPVQQYVEQKLTDELSDAIRRESGASLLRVGGPDAIWTMDYREERVNITFDADENIERITCG